MTNPPCDFIHCTKESVVSLGVTDYRINLCEDHKPEKRKERLNTIA